jgi:hypothetical protein
MTIEKAIELLKAGRYNEIEYLEAKNMAVEALEYQMKHDFFNIIAVSKGSIRVSESNSETEIHE